MVATNTPASAGPTVIMSPFSIPLSALAAGIRCGGSSRGIMDAFDVLMMVNPLAVIAVNR